IWWPGMMVGWSGGRSRSTMWRSVRQTPQARTRRRRWLGWSAGAGRFSMVRKLSGVAVAGWKTAARIFFVESTRANDTIPASHSEKVSMGSEPWAPLGRDPDIDGDIE